MEAERDYYTLRTLPSKLMRASFPIVMLGLKLEELSGQLPSEMPIQLSLIPMPASSSTSLKLLTPSCAASKKLIMSSLISVACLELSSSSSSSSAPTTPTNLKSI